MTKNRISTGGLTVKSTKENKTGSWRTFTPVITDKCIACGRCVEFCPEGCIFINTAKKRAVINYEYCKGCLICLNECPVKAIEKHAKKQI